MAQMGGAVVGSLWEVCSKKKKHRSSATYCYRPVQVKVGGAAPPYKIVGDHLLFSNATVVGLR